MQGPILVLDFDGTVTMKDIGDEICDRFSPPEWKEIDDLWVRNEISLPEAQRRMWALARATREEAVRYAHEVGHRRAGLVALLDKVDQAGGEAWLGSGGFDFYIEAILGNELGRFSQKFFNRTSFVDGRIEVSFPYNELACGKCAVCKGRLCARAKASGRRVIFVGDGHSDRCAIGEADVLYAVRGSRLQEFCVERGAKFRLFDSFCDVELD